MYIYWILLGLAIATEITGTLSMKWASVSEGNGGFILMLVMISLSYIFLSFAVKKIGRNDIGNIYAPTFVGNDFFAFSVFVIKVDFGKQSFRIAENVYLVAVAEHPRIPTVCNRYGNRIILF